ncbi:carboxypeptidase KEX1 [Multifurca ochricompacta]|uniref:Pheromone-processing carboxypeptidase KEX1 n=1 Tax=Multifurca ochricompacta TaxID=376703 RepID=A0AAD4MBZ0_9AGAM|nr:carboxypeptidase KEX1 [Multifurca ochricompacta]
MFLRWRTALGIALSFLLLPLASTAPTDVPSAASFYVPALPGLHQDPLHPLHIYAGHLNADPGAARLPNTTVTAHIYFVLIKARRTADKERIIFWFNGGPGCSSFDGLMMEVGPWRVDGNGGFKTIEGGWEEYTTMVYVDQPAGTGFSYTSTDRYAHDLNEASDQFIQFLRNFYSVFPEYKTMDTYIAGESFAGQYIPYFSDAVLNSNLGVPLRGSAIGNGWIDARRQYPAYLDYAVKYGLVEPGTAQYEGVKKATDECVALLNTMKGDPIHVDFEKAGLCLNVYDVRLKDERPACGMNWPIDLKNITSYLRRPDVVNALHAQAKSEAWVECQQRIHSQLNQRSSESSVTLLPRVLEKIPVLFFAGDQDLICNYVGQESLIQSLTWNGGTGLGKVETQTWTVGDTPAGTWVSSRNLTYVKIFNASHMAGYDQLHATHDMILRFMGMNFSAITDGTARKVTSATPTPPAAKTPEQDKAMWEAYYNAGSAAIVLVLIIAALGSVLWCRIRRRRLHGLPTSRNEEEHIPLTQGMSTVENRDSSDTSEFRTRKGKERAQEAGVAPIFDVGDSDEEGEGNHQNR